MAAFSPSGDARTMIEVWKGVAEKYKWFILASKEFRNGIEPDFEPGFVSAIKKLSVGLPIHPSRIISTGFSGGGMFAYFFAYDYPEMVSAVVSNCGVIHPDVRNPKEYAPLRGKLAVLMTAPGDSNYNPMKKDREFLEGFDWKIKWVEFSGGHSIGPEAAYQEAAEWLNEELNK